MHQRIPRCPRKRPAPGARDGHLRGSPMARKERPVPPAPESRKILFVMSDFPARQKLERCVMRARTVMSVSKPPSWSVDQ